MVLSSCSHQSLQQASVSESSLVQQELEQTQELLESRERELQAALEKVCVFVVTPCVYGLLSF